ncbi:MAG: hypothetical protein PHR51_00295 [Patescibacteria group bacterium]|nr:hypothetical protein [Patescibacteria group bacterium]
MINIFLTPLQELTQFLYWWVIFVPRRLFGWVYDSILAMDEVLVLGETFRLWIAIEPLFGDYGWQGRIIGFLFRFFRVLISLGIYFGILIVGLFCTVVWLVWPVLAILLILQIW